MLEFWCRSQCEAPARRTLQIEEIGKVMAAYTGRGRLSNLSSHHPHHISKGK